jgi:hypothetical protein
MAPTKKDKTRTKKLATKKKSSDNAAAKEIIKETKRSTRTPSSKNKRLTRTPSSKKLAKDKRRKSSLSSSARKKMRQNSTLRPIKVQLLDGKNDSLFTNKDDSLLTNKEAGNKTEDEVLESLTKTPTRNRDSALVRNHGDNDTNSYSTPTNQDEAGPRLTTCRETGTGHQQDAECQ